MATGWTWEYVWDHMTFQRLEAMNRVWKKSPPPHVNLAYITALLKAYLGVKDETRAPAAPSSAELLINLPDIEE